MYSDLHADLCGEQADLNHRSSFHATTRTSDGSVAANTAGGKLRESLRSGRNRELELARLDREQVLRCGRRSGLAKG
jgi:hypothetical protein